jgi:diguanylate cyclase (GGDEF)-like protein
MPLPVCSRVHVTNDPGPDPGHDLHPSHGPLDGSVALLAAHADQVSACQRLLEHEGVDASWVDPASLLAAGWPACCSPSDVLLVFEPALLPTLQALPRPLPRLVVLVEPADQHRSAQLLAAGAADVWSRDLPDVLLAQRLRDQLKLCRQQRTLARQGRYEAAVAECARLLVGRGPLAVHLQRVVEILQQASGVSRAYVFRTHEHPDLGLCVSQVHEACAPGIEPQIDNPQLQDQPFATEAPNALATLSTGEPFVGLVADLPEPERSMLHEQGIVSLLILPIVSAGSFWGFMGFDDCVYATRWQRDEIALLRIVAETSGLAIERQQAEQELVRLANSDALTGLHNRRFAHERLNTLLERASHNQQLLSIALLDIDWFKRINDTYGHPAGDAVLSRLARLLRDCFRAEDLLGRIGGEEFLVATPQVTPERLAARLQTLRQRLQAAPIWYEKHTIQVTFSAGIACSAEWETELTAGALIALADQRLYVAKHRGRDRIVAGSAIPAA